MLDVPTSVDRSMGDVHPFGNPHIHTNPHNIAKVADALAKRMGEVDAANRALYETRLKNFQSKWNDAIARWEQQGAALKGVPVLVVHQDQEYLLDWLGMTKIGALEPKPGVPPSTAHLSDLLQRLEKTPAKLILHSAYASPKAAQWMAERGRMPVATLPFTVGGTPEAKDLFSLFDDTLKRLLTAAK
jgi:zinc/manganese transport system substrate-binding protein